MTRKRITKKAVIKDMHGKQGKLVIKEAWSAIKKDMQKEGYLQGFYMGWQLSQIAWANTCSMVWEGKRRFKVEYTR